MKSEEIAWNGEALAMPSVSLLLAVWSASWWPPGYVEWRAAYTRRALAIHEASHAVAMMVGGSGKVGARLYDEPVGEFGADGQAFADITRAPDATLPASNPSGTALGALWNAVISHAGVQGELLEFGVAVTGELRYSAQDWIDATQALGIFPRSPHGWCQQVARCLLSENWPLVQRIARILESTGEWQANADTLPVKFSGTTALFAAAARHAARRFPIRAGS